MEVESSFERLVRLVQKTGERMIIALDTAHDPVVLLPLSAYEELVGQRGGGQGASFGDLKDSPVFPLSHVQNIGEIKKTSVPAEFEHKARQDRTPFLSPDDMDIDPVDAWDGETAGGEYDAERIFASASVSVGDGFRSRPRQEASHSPNPMSASENRIKSSISRASEAYGMLGKEGWQSGSGGQRLPISEDSWDGEERFSLGMG